MVRRSFHTALALSLLATGALLATALGAAEELPPLRPLVRVISERRGDEVQLVALLQDCTAACLTLRVELRNLRSAVPVPLTVDLTQARTLLTTLRPIERGQRWSFNYATRYQPGLRGARPETTHLYRRPFASVTPFRVGQGYGGAFSHQSGTPLEFSVDWPMPEGTQVLAARGGRVVAIRQNQVGGGRAPGFRDRANFIVVEHPDGTLAEYVHLRPYGVSVRPGQRIETGALLGHSGNTGFSSGPHLHVRIYWLDATGRARGLPARWDVSEPYDTVGRGGLPFHLEPLVWRK